MTLKFNILIITPTPSSVGNCARDIKLALIEARRSNKKIILLRCYEIFRPLKIKVANRELYNLESRYIYKLNPILLFVIQALLTLYFSLVRLVSYAKRLFFGKHLSYIYTTPIIGIFKTLRVNYSNFSPKEAFNYRWDYGFNKKINIDLHENKKTKLKKILQKIGMPENQWYACIHIREGGYYKDNVTERNNSISNFFLAIDYVIKQGGWVIRLGDSSMTKFPKFKNLIDYPFTPFKSEAMDLYLIKNCKFYIGTPSGPYEIAKLFDKPMVSIGSTNWLTGLPGNKNDIILFRHIYSKRHKKFLDHFEWMREGWKAMHYRSINENYIFYENSAEEILRAVKCMMNPSILSIENKNKYLSSKIFYGKKIISKKIYGYQNSQEIFSSTVNNPFEPNDHLYDMYVRYAMIVSLYFNSGIIKKSSKNIEAPI